MKKTLSGVALLVILAFALSASAAIDASSPYSRYQVAQSFHPNGDYLVFAQSKSGWKLAGALPFDQFYRRESVDLSRFATPGESMRVRLYQIGGGAAQIDAVSLGGAPALQCSAGDKALAKFAARDMDVHPVVKDSVDLLFGPSDQPTLELTARVEPEVLPTMDFKFPLANLGGPMSDDSSFYRYELNSHPGRITVDGLLDGIAEDKPFLRAFYPCGSGHPSSDFWVWVGNDDETLFVSMDFTADNTVDGDKDYTKVFVRTAAGVREFKASEPDTRWGRPGFGYTPRASWEHKTYEFAIPLAELGADARSGGPLELAFAAYGTALPLDIGVTKTGPATILAGQTVTYTVTMTSAAATRGVVHQYTARMTDIAPLEMSCGSIQCIPDVNSSCVGSTRNGRSSSNLGYEITFNPGATVVFTLGCTTSSGISKTTVVTNTADICLWDNIQGMCAGDMNPTNDQDTATTTIDPRYGLSLTKTGPEVVATGDPVLWTIVIHNDGPEATTGYMWDVITSDTPGVTVENPILTCYDGPTSSCQDLTRSPGLSDDFTIMGPGTITYTVAGTAGATMDPVLVTNTASVIGDYHNTRALRINQADASDYAETTIAGDDGDSVTPVVENNAPNNGDGNGDGVEDYRQSNVTSLPDYTGSNYVTMDAHGQSVNLTNFNTSSPQAAGAPVDLNMPYGVFSFTIENVAAGATINMNIVMPRNTSITGYYKKNRLTGEWEDVAVSVDHSQSLPDGTLVTIVTIQITDGGPYDNDGLVNGEIDDPGSPGFLAWADRTEIPALGPWGVGLLGLLLAGALGLIARRRQGSR